MFSFPDRVTFFPKQLIKGQVTYGNGVAIDARISSREQEVITAEGKKPTISKLAVYTETQLKTDDLVAEGDFDGQAYSDTITGGQRILSISRVPSATVTIRALI